MDLMTLFCREVGEFVCAFHAGDEVLLNMQ